VFCVAHGSARKGAVAAFSESVLFRAPRAADRRMRFHKCSNSKQSRNILKIDLNAKRISPERHANATWDVGRTIKKT
jgi:hypothetical protein